MKENTKRKRLNSPANLVEISLLILTFMFELFLISFLYAFVLCLLLSLTPCLVVTVQRQLCGTNPNHKCLDEGILERKLRYHKSNTIRYEAEHNVLREDIIAIFAYKFIAVVCFNMKVENVMENLYLNITRWINYLMFLEWNENG